MREYQLAVLVFLTVHQYLNLISYGKGRVITEFRYRNNSFGFCIDVHDYLAVGFCNYRSFHNFVFVHSAEGIDVHLLHFLVFGLRNGCAGFVCFPVEIFQRRYRCLVFL